MPVRGTGFRIFWQRGDSAGYRDFTVGTGLHFIVGAHSLADIVLSGDDDVSQRHLLILGALTPSGAPALRILDLRARFPMFLADDRPHRSLRVHGAFALRLGGYVLAGFPLGEEPPENLPEVDLEPIPTVTLQGASVQGPLQRPEERTRTVLSSGMVAVADRPASAGGPFRHITRIEALKRPSTLVEVASSRRGGASATLLARRGTTEAIVPLSEEDLVGGVLIGRAERCLDAGLRHVMTMTTSRIHAILISEARDGSVHLLDAASTNGTFVDGTRVRSALLGPGAKVRLGTEIDLELRR